MAVTSSPPGADAPRSVRPRPRLFWSRLHFLIRLLGLSGGLLACVCGVFAAIYGAFQAFRGVANVQEAYTVSLESARTALAGPSANLPMVLFLAGAATALLALLIELMVALGFSATRRSAFGFNAILQGALATALLVAINVWSFHHYQWVDFTRDQQFTLPAEVRQDLAQLDPNSKTTLIVYLRQKVFDLMPDRPEDPYESAAERKVVEKVKDLAELLREAGSQHLTVEVLDTQAPDLKFKEQLERLTADSPELRKAIKAAPENSLFFYARNDKGKESIQRLSFNDFYLLDKTASQEDRDNRGNLVLLSQGMEPFARRVTHLEEKRPRIGIAVLDASFSSSSDLFYGLKGLRLALEKRGFEVQDVVLKKWTDGEPVADAATLDETALRRLKEKLATIDKLIAGLKVQRGRIVKSLEVWKKAVDDAKTRAELTRQFADQLDGGKITVEDARLNVAFLEDSRDYLDKASTAYEQRKQELEEEKSKLNEPALRERQRETDVQAKMGRWLADLDLLILPRLTLWDLGSRLRLPPPLHKLDHAQVEAIKEFLKAGKPVLACFGPSTLLPEDRGRSADPDEEKPDELEKALTELGVKFGKETVLFFDEQEALAEARSGAGLGGVEFEPPPVRFDWRAGEGRPVGVPRPPDKPNPIRESMRLTARALGKDDEGRNLPLDIRIRHPRPIYFVPPKGSKPAFEAEFLLTSPRCWNEDQLPARGELPQFERPKARGQDAKLLAHPKDPLDERRQGPFPIGVAFQTRLPKSWYGSEAAEPATVRLAVLGQGSFFTGKKLPDAQERLFVNTINWLLGNDDRLPRDQRVGSYPRVNDTIPPDSPAEYLWLWGVRLGLPVLFTFFGFVVLLFRRLR